MMSNPFCSRFTVGDCPPQHLLLCYFIPSTGVNLALDIVGVSMDYELRIGMVALDSGECYITIAGMAEYEIESWCYGFYSI